MDQEHYAGDVGHDGDHTEAVEHRLRPSIAVVKTQGMQHAQVHVQFTWNSIQRFLIEWNKYTSDAQQEANRIQRLHCMAGVSTV